MKKVLIIISVIILACLAFLFYSGLFTKVEIIEKESESYQLVYEEHLGDYSKSGEITNKIYHSLLNDYNIETFKGFGIYYDNPQEVEKEKLRSEVGCILETADYNKIDTLKGKYKIKEFLSKKCMITEFPFKNKISIFLGIMEVYPELEKYSKANGYNLDAPVMEIYDMPNKKIIYLKYIEQ